MVYVLVDHFSTLKGHCIWQKRTTMPCQCDSGHEIAHDMPPGYGGRRSIPFEMRLWRKYATNHHRLRRECKGKCWCCGRAVCNTRSSRNTQRKTTSIAIRVMQSDMLINNRPWPLALCSTRRFERANRPTQELSFGLRQRTTLVISATQARTHRAQSRRAGDARTTGGTKSYGG